ncbi:MAG: hypothetical protein ACJ74U_05740 [Jatrophihabitantaceae bacterium]
MAKVRPRTPQQLAARELALTPAANPYRGSLTDPFSRPVDGQPTGGQGAAQEDAEKSAAEQPDDQPSRIPRGAPGAITLAGILGIALGLTLGLFGLLLLTIVSLQNDYGAPDRSFYRGTDSGYVVLGLVNFGLAACCGIGGIVLMTGRLSGRIAVTVGGWATMMLSGFWLLDGAVRDVVPIVLAVAAATMLFFSYQRPVTDWLGVLPPPQPE